MESFPLREIVTMLLAGRPADRWLVRDDEDWCHVTPHGHPARVQGWKLHVSATWLSAPMVLHQAAQVLLEQRCAFKFAGTLARVRLLTNRDTDRAQAGKVITVYPRDDDQLRTIAPLLDRATAGLPGPAVLSDRPYRKGSLVSYRYGAFTGVRVLTNEGAFETRLEAPDGTPVADARQPWFCPPSWAQPPYPGPPGREAGPPARPQPVLLGGRFVVERAIRHSARGGVFRATDQTTGERVVVKQARAHINGLSHLGDARDALRYESAMLRSLAGLGPRQVALFEQGEHLFLAVEELAGEPLGVWASRWWSDPPGGAAASGPPVDEALALAGRLADVVAAVHERGLVYRDLSPGNVMVLKDGAVRLIDAELAAHPGQWVSRAHTPGFAAPEVLGGAAIAPAPEPSADYFSLGALLCFLVTGAAPPTLPDRPAGEEGRPDHRTATDRIALLLRYAAPGNPAATRLAPAILGLTAADPARRWTPARLREFLAEPGPGARAPAAGEPARLEPERQRRLRDDGLAYLLTRLAGAASDRLVPTGEYGARSDPCNVQHGAAGVLAVLVRASELAGTESLREAVARVAKWIDRRRLAVSPLLPGLYFGRAGTAWALYAAGRHLGDTGLSERALQLAESLPVRWPNPDLTHGSAGLGLALLHLWYETKEPALLDRVDLVADSIREHAVHTETGHLYWRTAPDFDSTLAGVAHLGLAHGVAGIGAFLLAAAVATGREEYHELAGQAGETLAAAAVRSGGAAYWPNSVSGPDPSDVRYYWCSGAAGVGTFLVRLWQATGQDRYRQLAHEAAVMVRRAPWFSGVAACHGLAGNGEFLLDLAVATGEASYRAWAEEHAAAAYARHALRGGRVVFSEETAGRLNLDFNTGLAGLVGFVLRLCHGGPRWWMVDGPGAG